MSKPSEQRIKTEIRNLRKFIESDKSDPLECRLAQIAEDTLRWAIEDTTWAGPRADLEGMAGIIRRDLKLEEPTDATHED